MREYEICILQNNGSPSLIAMEMQLSDHAAIRSATKLAAGRRFQVWRGGDCIYGMGAQVADNPADAGSRHI